VLGEIKNGEYALCVVKKKVGVIYLDVMRQKSWRNDLADKRFTSVDPEIGIRRVATNKDKDKLQKFGLYLNMYKEKWKRAVIKQED
jgi:hypothetical protein